MHACFPAPDTPLPCCLQLKEIRDYRRNALTPGQPPKIEEPEESEEEEEEEEEDDEEAQVSAEEEEVCLSALAPASPFNKLDSGLAGQPLGGVPNVLPPAHASIIRKGNEEKYAHDGVSSDLSRRIRGRSVL